jgi:hypothetical protein
VPTPLGPYYQGPATQPNFKNPRTHQIISAGQDAVFGYGGSWDSANGTVVTQFDKDNQANFAALVLGTTQ